MPRFYQAAGRSLASRARALVLLVGVTSGIASCAPPRLAGLPGAPVPAHLPRVELPAGHRRVVFRWELQQRFGSARGEGVARVAPPDSARFDFFLQGGIGSGSAILLADSLRFPGNDDARQYLPPAALLWASLGRLSIPALRDTVARVDGGLLRVDIGVPPQWRLTFRTDSLVRVERVSDGRIAEWVERDGDHIRYRNEKARRTLLLTVTRVDTMPPFDASIWSAF
jgi:hypothetical protein